MKNKIQAKNLKEALKKTLRVQKNAYAPYSRFLVGATIITKKGLLYSGHNIENASFGGTVCAERVAIFQWAMHDRRDAISAIVIATKFGVPPCGYCLQTMAEFFAPETLLHLVAKNKIVKTYSFSQLLPVRFDPACLDNSDT